MRSETMGERSIGDATRTAVAMLTTAEQFVLGVCRCWDTFMEDPDPTLPWRELWPVFAYMDVLSALCAFERTFSALHRHQHRHRHRPRTLQFQEVDSPSVGTDEARMLCSLACLQRGHARATIRVLAESLARCDIRAILPPMARIATILDMHGHRLPSWHHAVER
jgi:hypothetical protein